MSDTPNDPSAFFSPSFVAEFERAVLGLPADHRNVTWANGERGPVAAMVGPIRGAFLLAQEEGSVWLVDKVANEKKEIGPIGHVSGAAVAVAIGDVLGKRAA